MALRLSICMLTGVFSRVFAGINMQYILYSSLSGYTCPDNRTLFDRMGVRSEIICAAKCTETRTCFGVFHRRQDMRCIGCEDKFLRSETTPLLNGTRYYRRKTYKLIDKKLTWSKSKQRCEDIGGHLAYIKSQGEQLFIETHVTSDNGNTMWLGGQNSGNMGEFFWEDGDPVSAGYSKWRDGHPLPYDSSKQCMVLSKFDREWTWRERPCGLIRYGLCEFE